MGKHKLKLNEPREVIPDISVNYSTVILFCLVTRRVWRSLLSEEVLEETTSVATGSESVAGTGATVRTLGSGAGGSRSRSGLSFLEALGPEEESDVSSDESRSLFSLERHINESPPSYLVLSCKVALKPLRETQEGDIVQWHWLKEIEPWGYFAHPRLSRPPMATNGNPLLTKKTPHAQARQIAW